MKIEIELSDEKIREFLETAALEIVRRQVSDYFSHTSYNNGVGYELVKAQVKEYLASKQDFRPLIEAEYQRTLHQTVTEVVGSQMTIYAKQIAKELRESFVSYSKMFLEWFNQQKELKNGN